MIFAELVTKINDMKVNLLVQVTLLTLGYIVIKYKYKKTDNTCEIDKKMQKKLIKNFKPLPIVSNVQKIVPISDLKYNFSNFDIFNLGSMYKDQIKECLKIYGVGTCGPRGFYGTLDLHLKLEEKIATLFKKDAGILYSNYLTCVQSIISCFCKSRNNVYVYENASEAIKTGLKLSLAKVHYFASLEDLKEQLNICTTDRYLIIEKVAKNTGEIIDIKQLLQLKEKHSLRIILDETFSIPFLYQQPGDVELYSNIDLVIGSLSHGYPTNGAFCVGCKEAIEYQRLSGSAYVFSASLPAFLSKAAMLMLDEKLDYNQLKENVKFAFENLKNVISDESHPVILIEVDDLDRKIKKMRESGFAVGKHGKYLRLVVTVDLDRSLLLEAKKILEE